MVFGGQDFDDKVEVVKKGGHMADEDNRGNVEHVLLHRIRRDLRDLRNRKKPKGQIDFDAKKARLRPDWEYFRANGARVVGACQMAQELGRSLEQMVDFEVLMTEGGRLTLGLEALCEKVENITRDPSSQPSVNERCRAALSLLALMEELEWHFVD
jgi:hypothetical protein